MILDMKTITKGKTPFLAIPVPKEAFYFDWKWSAREEHIIIYWETEDGWVQGVKTDFKSPFHFEILDKFSELCEMECEEFVDCISLRENDYTIYKNYISKPEVYIYVTAKQSLLSLLNSEGFDENTLIVKILC
jgi:hypothetical protein